MELTHEFTVSAPIERAWSILTDLAQVAPCLPGAELEEVDGEDYRGTIGIKVGPISARYKGVARIAEKDDAGHRVVVHAQGRDTRGQGNASADITMTLSVEAERTKADVHTDLSISGKVAQMGRGVLGDVSKKLMDQFAGTLEARLADAPTSEANEGENATGDAQAVGSLPAVVPQASVNVLSLVGPTLLKRLTPIALVALALGALRRVRARRRAGTS